MPPPRMSHWPILLCVHQWITTRAPRGAWIQDRTWYQAWLSTCTVWAPCSWIVECCISREVDQTWWNGTLASMVPRSQPHWLTFMGTFKGKCLSDPAVGFEDMVACVHAACVTANLHRDGGVGTFEHLLYLMKWTAYLGNHWRTNNCSTYNMKSCFYLGLFCTVSHSWLYFVSKCKVLLHNHVCSVRGNWTVSLKSLKKVDEQAIVMQSYPFVLKLYDL